MLPSVNLKVFNPNPCQHLADRFGKKRWAVNGPTALHIRCSSCEWCFPRQRMCSELTYESARWVSNVAWFTSHLGLKGLTALLIGAPLPYQAYVQIWKAESSWGSTREFPAYASTCQRLFSIQVLFNTLTFDCSGASVRSECYTCSSPCK